MTSPDAQAYLRRVLALDARWQLEDITRLRAEFRSAAKSADAASETPLPAATRLASPPEPRDKLRAELKRLGSSLATTARPDARDALQRLELHGQLDLERYRARLLAVHDARGEVKRMLADRELAPTLASDLAALLSDDPQRSAERRNRSVFAVGYELSSRMAGRFAKRVRARYPALAALEDEWLQRLENSRAELRDSRMIGHGPGCGLISLTVSIVGASLIGALSHARTW